MQSIFRQNSALFIVCSTIRMEDDKGSDSSTKNGWLIPIGKTVYMHLLDKFLSGSESFFFNEQI